jgi:cytidylate kinase
MIIAIDGPAGAGKSTVAQALAERLGLDFLDTGAMYRAVTVTVLAKGVDPHDAGGCEAIADVTQLEFDDRGRMLVDGELAEPAIRSGEVSRAVSAVSAHPAVRERIVPLQRARARLGRGVVAEGRDTTTVVFPDADHKFFLIASSRERARRRAEQIGEPERLEEIMAAIDTRDHKDATRSESPLIQAPDAILIDTDGREAVEVIAMMLELISASGTSSGDA